MRALHPTSFAAFGLGLVVALAARTAHADDSQCSTARAEAEVLRESVNERGERVQKIQVREGETLCFTGEPASGGELWDPIPIEHLHLTSDIERAQWVIRLVRLRGDVSAVAIENRSSDRFFFSVDSPSPVVGSAEFYSHADLSLWTTFNCGPPYRTILPKARDTVVLGVSVSEVSLSVFGQAPMPTPHSKWEAPEWFADDIGLGLEMGSGLQGLGVSELNRALAENGYASHPSMIVPWTLLLSGQLGPLVLRISVAANTESVGQAATGSESDVEYGATHFEGGFRVRLSRSLAVMPYLGIGGASLELTVPHDAPPFLPEQLSAYPTPTTVKYSSVVMPAGVDVEGLLPIFEHKKSTVYLSLRARAGYSFDWGGDPWEVDSPEETRAVDDGPTPYLGGPFFLLTLGAQWRTRVR